MTYEEIDARVLRARSVEVIDESGMPRIRLSTVSAGSVPILAIADETGQSRIGLVVYSDGRPGVEFYDSNAVQRMALCVASDGTPALRLNDADGRLRIEATVSQDGTPQVRLLDAAGGAIFETASVFQILAKQAAFAFDNSALVKALERADGDLAGAYDATLECWVEALDARSKEVEGHTQRVTEFTVRVARTLGIGDKELNDVRRGAVLHDVGKIVVPDAILLKPGPVNDEEREIIQRHPVYAAAFLSTVPYLRSALDIPYYHHERWDGSGYPLGLRDEQIPLAARIFAVVESWDVLTSDRPYRRAWTPEQAQDYLRERAGKDFDAKVVEAFLRIVP